MCVNCDITSMDIEQIEKEIGRLRPPSGFSGYPGASRVFSMYLDNKERLEHIHLYLQDIELYRSGNKPSSFPEDDAMKKNCENSISSKIWELIYMSQYCIGEYCERIKRFLIPSVEHLSERN